MKDAPSAPVEAAGLPWFVRVGATGILFDSSASLTLAGATVAGASAKAGDNITAMFEAGYYINNNLSVQLTGGYPPTTALKGTGAIAGLGTLGKASYGPAGVSFNYHLTNFGAFQPYLGAGIVYAIIFGTKDGAVSNLRIPGSGDWVLQGGFDYFLTRNWSVFVDARKVFLTLSASGDALGFPVGANVRLDPTIVSGGVTYHW
jgi:outer membrane protein